MAMSNDLSIWLASELKTRGWSIRELSRRAGIAHTTIADVLSGQTNPTLKFCLAVARPLEFPSEMLIRKAGILPELQGPEEDITFGELLEVVRDLSIEERRDVLEYALLRRRLKGQRGKP